MIAPNRNVPETHNSPGGLNKTQLEWTQCWLGLRQKRYGSEDWFRLMSLENLSFRHCATGRVKWMTTLVSESVLIVQIFLWDQYVDGMSSAALFSVSERALFSELRHKQTLWSTLRLWNLHSNCLSSYKYSVLVLAHSHSPIFPCDLFLGLNVTPAGFRE